MGNNSVERKGTQFTKEKAKSKMVVNMESSQIPGNIAKSSRKKRNSLCKPQLIAVVMTPANGKTYSDVLKEIRGKLNPKESQAKVRTNHKTQQECVLLELQSKTQRREGFL